MVLGTKSGAIQDFQWGKTGLIGVKQTPPWPTQTPQNTPKPPQNSPKPSQTQSLTLPTTNLIPLVIL